jgi:PAS domain S-box-containing protein
MISVLYVDDEPGLLEIGKLFLEENGHFRVETITSAPAALNLLDTKSYDAIISDYQMPGMDGIVFLKAVRERFFDIPFILFTGRGREAIVIQAINEGADFYLQKGGDPAAQFAELAHKVRQAVARRLAERSLIESEKRLSDIINFLPDATFAIDKSGHVIAWNHAIEEMTGVHAADILGKGEYEYAIPFYGKRQPILIDLIFESDDIIARNYDHITHKNDILIADTKIPRPKGKPLTLMGKASPLYNRQGEIVGAIESIRDITEREQDVERLAQKTKTLSIINELIQVTNLQQDIEETLRSVLRTILDLLHYDAGGVYVVNPEQQTARIVCSENLDPAFVREVDNIDIRQPPYNRVFIGGEPVITESFDTLLPHAAESSGFRSVASIPIISQNVVTGALNIASKQRSLITPDEREILLTIGKELGNAHTRMKTALALRESEDKYRTLVELLPDAVVVHRDGKILYANPECVRLAKAGRAEDLVDKEVLSFIHPDDRQKAIEDFRRIAVEGRTIPLEEERLLTVNGEVFTVEVTAMPIMYQHLPSMLAVFRDITERKRSQLELRAAYEQITAAEEELRSQLDELIHSNQQIQESEENFQSLVESAPDAIYISAGEKFAYVNPAMVRLMGATSADQLLGMSLYDRIHPSFHEEIQERARVVIGERKPVGLKETVYLKMDGTPVDIESAVATFRYRNSFAGLVILRDITRRKQAETELMAAYEQITASEEELRGQYEELARSQRQIQESEERYHTVIETTGTGFVILDGEGGVIDANPEYVRLTGHDSLSGIIGRNVIEWTAPDSKERNAEAIVRCMSEGSVRNVEIDYIDAAGGITPIEINATVLRSVNSVQIVTLCRDISERRKADFALKNSVVFLNSLIEQSPYSMAISDENGVLVRVNNACCDMLKITPEEVVGRYNFLNDPIVKEQGKESLVRSVFEKGRAVTFDLYYDTSRLGNLKLAQSTYVILQVSIFPILDSNGKITNAVIQHVNVTEQRKAEEELRESEERFRRLIAGSFDAVVLHQEGTIVLANDAAARILRAASTAELVGRLVLDLVHPEYQEKVAARIQQMLQSQEATVPLEEEKFIRSDGTAVDVEVMATATHNESLPAVMVVFRDITERKKAENSLRLANRQLDLLTGITRHDILNKVAVILGFLKVAEKKFSDPALVDLLRKMESTAVAIKSQIEFTRIYQDLGSHEPQWIKLDTIMPRSHIPAAITLNADVRDVSVFADPMLGKVFFNLLDNAVRHGQQVTEIRVSSRQSGEDLVVVWEDNGIGIAAGEKELIFERGFGKNTGLGMFLVREILSLTGITITERGEPGNGVLFEIVVPKDKWRMKRNDA